MPRVAQTLALLLARERFLAHCRRRHGDLVALRPLIGPDFVVVFDAATTAELLRAAPERAQAGAANAASEPLHGTSALLLADGDRHLDGRRLLSPCFHGERMRARGPAIQAAADRAIDSWPVARPFALAPSMRRLSLDVIIDATVALDDSGERAALVGAVQAMLDSSSRRRFRRHRDAAQRVVDAEIARRLAGDPQGADRDALATLMAASPGAPGGVLEARDQVMMLLVAGHETTASALTWAFALLLSKPSALEGLRASLATGEDEYLAAVIAETLRVRPVVTGIGRLVRGEPLQLAGRWVAPGTEVVASIEALHAGAAYAPDPHEFRPERFLGSAPPRSPAWLAFGGGTRRCLGAAFAGFELEIVIRRVIERATLRRAGRPERAVRRGVTPPTGAALARALRRGRRTHPRRGLRVVQPMPPAPAAGLE